MSDQTNPTQVEETCKIDSAIDVKLVLDQIRADISQKGYIREMLSFEDIRPKSDIHPAADQPYDTLQMLLDNREMNETYHTQLERQLLSSGGMAGKAKLFFKRVIRKCVRFYISPYTTDQEAFNAASTRFSNQVASYLMEQEHGDNALQGLDEKVIKLLNKDMPRLLQDVVDCQTQIQEANNDLIAIKHLNERLIVENEVLRAKVELLELKWEKELISRQPEGRE